MHIRLELRFAAAAVVLAAAVVGCTNGRGAPVRAAAEPAPHGASVEPGGRPPPDPTMGPPPAVPPPPYASPEPGAPALEPPPPVALPPPERKEPYYGEDVPNGRVLAPSDEPLTDAQIVGVVLVLDRGEVATAEIAVEKASDPDVRDLAVAVKEHHASALRELDALRARARLGSAESDVTAYLRSNAEGTLRELREESGEAFDRAYVDAVIEAHRNALAAIDGRLAPNARNRKLQALLVEMRARVADHLARAERVREKLLAGSGGG